MYMTRQYIGRNVYEALQERLKFIFEEFENIFVSFSGGKDSGLLLSMVLDFRRKYYPELYEQPKTPPKQHRLTPKSAAKVRAPAAIDDEEDDYYNNASNRPRSTGNSLLDNYMDSYRRKA